MDNDQTNLIDNELLEYNLSLTFEERLVNHEKALRLLREILKAREALYGKLESFTEDSARDQY